MWRSAQYVNSDALKSVDNDDWDTDPDFVVSTEYVLILIIVGDVFFCFHCLNALIFFCH